MIIDIDWTFSKSKFASISVGNAAGWVESINITIDFQQYVSPLTSLRNVLSFFMSYFEQCKPYECRHIVHRRKNFAEVIVTLLGLVGGLYTILYFG